MYGLLRSVWGAGPAASLEANWIDKDEPRRGLSRQTSDYSTRAEPLPAQSRNRPPAHHPPPNLSIARVFHLRHRESCLSMAFPSADGGADAGSGEGVSGADSGGRGHARGHPGEGAASGGRGHGPGHTGEGFSLARPWEAPGLNPGQPLRWFSRLAVAIGFRPDPNKRRGYTPTPTQIVPVDLSPTQIERAELYQFKKHLDDLLKEARLELKTPAEFDSNISVTVLKPWQGVLVKSAIAFASMRRPGAVQMRWKLGFTAVDVYMDNQSLNSKYVRLLNEFTFNMKSVV